MMDVDLTDPSVATRTLILLVLAALAAICILLSRKQDNKLPPFPCKPLPLIGHLHLVVKNPRGKFQDWRRKCGDIFSLYYGNKLVIVLNGYDTVKEGFVNNAENLSDRPDTPPVYAEEDDKKGGIGDLSGPEWKEQRMAALNILRSFGMGKNVLAEKILDEISVYLDKIKEFSGEANDLDTLTNMSIANIICSITLGKRFDYDDALFCRPIVLIKQLMTLMSSAAVTRFLPYFNYIPGDPFNARKFLLCFRELKEAINDHLIKKTLDKRNNRSEIENFMTEYLKEMERKKSQGKSTTMNLNNLLLTVIDFLIAGTETTSGTIMWFLLFMLHNPEVQEKVYLSIRKEIGTERLPTFRDKSKLNYLNAAIMETQRLCSIGPLGVPHSCKEDTTVRGFRIPKNTIILANMDSVLLDEIVWDEPSKFKPERFLDGNGDLNIPEQFIPYGIGKRICIGEALARMELFLYASSIVQKFKFEPEDSNHLPPFDAVFGITASPKAFKIRMIERRE